MTVTPVDRALIDTCLAARGLELPPPWKVPSTPGTAIPASLIRVTGDRVFVSGHVPTDENGVVTGPYGKVGAEVDLPTAQHLAVRTILSVIASVENAVGDLSRVKAWCVLRCMVDSAPDFTDFPAVFSGSSRLLLDAFGADIGAHARVAIGVAGLPWNLPVEIEAELELF